MIASPAPNKRDGGDPGALFSADLPRVDDIVATFAYASFHTLRSTGFGIGAGNSPQR